MYSEMTSLSKGSNAPVVLMAHLSLACKQETHFVEALKTALQWHFDDIGSYESNATKTAGELSPLIAAMLINSRTALVWIRNIPSMKVSSAVESLLGIPKFMLSGPLWVKFSAVQTGSLSNIVELYFKYPRTGGVHGRNSRFGKEQSHPETEGDQSFDRICEKISRALSSDPSGYYDNTQFHISDNSAGSNTVGSSSGRMCIKFESTEHAVIGCAKILPALTSMNKKGDQTELFTLKNVEIREHCVVRGCYEGRGLSFGRMIEKLRATHSQSLPEFVVTALNVLPKRPLLLSVQMVATGSTFGSTGGSGADGADAEEDVLVLICAANYDLQVLLKHEVCELVGGARLHFRKQAIVMERPLETKSVGADLPSREVFVIWDIESCDPAKPFENTIFEKEFSPSREVASIADNIDVVISSFPQQGNSSTRILKINKFVFLSEESYHSNSVNAKYVQELAGRDYTKLTCSKKTGVGLFMRGEVEKMVQRYKREKRSEGPVFCLLMNEAQFLLIAAFLKLENINDIILVHSTPINRESSLFNLVRQHLDWQKVGILHTFNRTVKNSIFRESFILDSKPAIAPLISEPPGMAKAPLSGPPSAEKGPSCLDSASVISNRLRLERMDRWRFLGGKAPALPEEKPADGQYSTSQGPTSFDTTHSSYVEPAHSSTRDSHKNDREVKIDLRYLSVACYFTKLIEWNRPPAEKSSSGALLQQQIKPIANATFSDHFLFGEIVRDKCSYDEEDANIEQKGEVAVIIDSKSSKYTLVLRGNLSSRLPHGSASEKPTLADKRLLRLQQMVDDTIQIRQIHQLSSYWKRQHRLGISDSDIINSQEEQSRSCVLFHHSGATTLVEIVSLRHNQHNRIKKFLDSLVPRECKREIPIECIQSYDDVAWEALRKKFAIVIEVAEPKDGRHGLVSSGKDYEFLKGASRTSSTYSSITAWGFGSFVDQAFEFLTTHQIATAEKEIPDREPYFREKEQHRQSATYFDEPVEMAQKYSETPGKIPLSHLPASLGSKAVKGSYTFQDCEAGIFFFAFEKEFREYIEHNFGVRMEDSGGNKSAYKSTDDREDGVGLGGVNDSRASAEASRKAVLKVEFFGPSGKATGAAKSYLEQLNTANLARSQIYFPQSSSGKYRELQNKKALQQTILRGIRLKETMHLKSADGSVSGMVDPLCTKGFINIRIKPPLNSRGIRRMSLPADTTVTVCGSLLPDGNAELLAEIEHVFESVASEYITHTVRLPSSNPCAKILTMKSTRSEFIQRHGLVELKWEEGNKMKGNIGCAKLWASSMQSMDSALNEIRSAESTTIPLENSFERDSNPASLDGTESQLSEKIRYSDHDQSGGMNTSHEDSFRSYSAPSVKTSPCLTLSPISNQRDSKSSSGIGSDLKEFLTSDFDFSSAQLDTFPAHFNFGHSALNLDGVFASANSSSLPLTDCGSASLDKYFKFANQADEGEDRRVVPWPNISLSYVFTGDIMKQRLQDLLTKYKFQGLKCKYPFRERADPSIAGVLVEGQKSEVSQAALEIATLFQSTAAAMKCVMLVVSEQPQYLQLVANDMGEINYIQGCVGVHIALDHKPFECSTMDYPVESVVDLRFLSTSPVPSGKMAHEDQEMLAVNVINNKTGSNIAISVISRNCSDVGWTWGVNSLLVLLDSDEDSIMRFTAAEKQVLNNGGVLVHTDSTTNKTFLQVKPIMLKSSANQADELVKCILRGLTAANANFLTGVAVSAPVESATFAEMSKSSLRSLTVDAVVQYVRQAASFCSIRKIACIELPSQQTSDSPLSGPSVTNSTGSSGIVESSLSLRPGGGDIMVQTLLNLLEQQVVNCKKTSVGSQKKSFVDVDKNSGEHLSLSPSLTSPVNPSTDDAASSSSGGSADMSMNITSCTVPLPSAFYKSPQAFSSVFSSRGPFGSALGDAKRFKAFLISGLPSGIETAVELLTKTLKLKAAI